MLEGVSTSWFDTPDSNQHLHGLQPSLILPSHLLAKFCHCLFPNSLFIFLLSLVLYAFLNCPVPLLHIPNLSIFLDTSYLHDIVIASPTMKQPLVKVSGCVVRNLPVSELLLILKYIHPQASSQPTI